MTHSFFKQHVRRLPKYVALICGAYFLVLATTAEELPKACDEQIAACGVAQDGSTLRSKSENKATFGPLLKRITGQVDVVKTPYSAELLGALSTPGLREASGIAQSRRDPKVIWAHNDSGYGAYLFAFDHQAKGLGRVVLNKVRAYDWEDMASFMWRNEPWLLIADTGDNAARRKSYVFYLIREPELGEKKPGQLLKVDVDAKVTFKYPDGPADTEAVAVDEQAGKIYLLTKRQRPPRIYSLPLPAYPRSDERPDKRPAETGNVVIDATFETVLHPLPRATVQDLLNHPKIGWYQAQPTAMDFSKEGDFAVVKTYGYGYRFARSGQQSWTEALSTQPVQFDLPLLEQGEAIAISSDGQSLFLTSEGRNAPLYRLWPQENEPDVSQGNLQ